MEKKQGFTRKQNRIMEELFLILVMVGIIGLGVLAWYADRKKIKED